MVEPKDGIPEWEKLARNFYNAHAQTLDDLKSTEMLNTMQKIALLSSINTVISIELDMFLNQLAEEQKK